MVRSSPSLFGWGRCPRPSRRGAGGVPSPELLGLLGSWVTGRVHLCAHGGSGALRTSTPGVVGGAGGTLWIPGSGPTRHSLLWLVAPLQLGRPPSLRLLRHALGGRGCASVVPRCRLSGLTVAHSTDSCGGYAVPRTSLAGPECGGPCPAPLTGYDYAPQSTRLGATGALPPSQQALRARGGE